MAKRRVFYGLPKRQVPKDASFATRQNGDAQKIDLLRPAKTAVTKRRVFWGLPKRRGPAGENHARQPGGTFYTPAMTTPLLGRSTDGLKCRLRSDTSHTASLTLHCFIAVFLFFLGGCSTSSVSPPPFELNGLSKFDNGPENKLDHFITVAMSLQAMGREAGSQALLRAAAKTSEIRDPGAHEQVVVLCRMLFKFREGVEYRHPSLGHTDFYAGTTNADWPLEPIELVDGYPFWIVPGYSYDGWRRPVATYVEYCIANCEWSTFKYRELSKEEKRAALAKLLSSPKWKRPLNERERWFLSSQIK